MQDILIQDILPGLIALFLASVLFTVCSFVWVRKLLEKFRASLWLALLFGSVNGVIAVLAEYYAAFPLPAVMMALVPLLSVLEIRLVSGDKPWAYFFILGAFLINFGAIHDLVVAVVGLLPTGGMWPKTSMEYRIAIFTLALLFSSFMLFLLSLFMPHKELYSLIHRSKKSLMLVLYMYMSSAVLLVASTVSVPVLFSDGLARSVVFPVSIDMVLKDLLILACSYLITLTQCHSEETSQQVSTITDRLNLEKEFRTTIQHQSVMSYCFNVTKNRISDGEGLEHFKACLRGDPPDDYRHILRAFVGACIHPDDHATILDHGAYLVTKEEMAAGHNTQALRFRMSLREFEKVTEGTSLGAYDLAKVPDWVWFEARATLIIDASSGDTLAYIDLVDVQDTVEKEEKLVSAASYDAVTRILNRATLEDGIRLYLSQKDATGAMFIIDMDNFKLVNDSFGHVRGDALLQEMAVVIQSVFRKGDIIGRLGGDEFCVFAAGLRHAGAVWKKAEELVAATKCEHKVKGGGSFETTVSIGIALCPDDGDEYAALYEYADQALYSAKLQGKNRFCFYQDGKGPG